MALRARRCAIRKKNIIKKKLIKNFEIAYGVAWSKVRSRIRSGGGVNSFETSYGVAWSKVGKRRRSGARTSAALPLGSYMC